MKSSIRASPNVKTWTTKKISYVWVRVDRRLAQSLKIYFTAFQFVTTQTSLLQLSTQSPDSDNMIFL